MITVKNKYPKLFNTVIKVMLEDILDDELIIGDLIEEIMPKYLRREQFENCVVALNDLKKWSQDTFKHDLKPIHQILLYNLLEENINKKKDLDLLKKTELNQSITSVIKKYQLKITKRFYNLEWYQSQFFEDIDFLKIEELYQKKILGSYLEKNKNFLNKYFSILPKKIQKEFAENHQSLEEKVIKLLEFINKRIEEGNLSELFWHDSTPLKEAEIQVLLENLMDNFFYKQELDITREALIGPGKLDFKFYSTNSEKVLIEVKKGKSTTLEQGYETQIIDYMKSWDCKKAFYLIICYTEKEIKRARDLLQKKKIIDPLHYNVKIILLDVRKKENLKTVKETKRNDLIDHKIDEIFKKIPQNFKIKTIEEAKLKLKEIKKDYQSLPNRELKESYVLAIQKIANDKVIQINPLERLFDENRFYQIFSSDDSVLQFILSIFLLNQSQNMFTKNINNVIKLWDSFTFDNQKNQVNEQEIKEGINFLKETHSNFYQLLTELSITFYLVDATNKIQNTMCFAYVGFRHYQILCYRNEFNNYFFSYLYSYGIILYFLTLRFNKPALMLFKEFFLDVKKESIESEVFYYTFAEMFTRYLCQNSKYEKLNAEIFPQELYDQMSLYFSRLIVNLKEKLKEGKE